MLTDQNIKIMKKIMIALMGIMFIAISAQAQNRKSKIKVCDHDKSTVLMQEKQGKYTTVSNYDQYIVVKSNKDNPRFKVQYDKPGDAYEGKEVMFNDGVEANIARNINYLDFSVNRPPVDGGISK